MRLTKPKLGALTFLALGAIGILSSGGEHDSRVEQTPGRALYAAHCSKCHGQGDSAGSATNLADGKWIPKTGAFRVRKHIKYGIQDLGMPAFQQVLSDEEIASIEVYLKLVNLDRSLYSRLDRLSERWLKRLELAAELDPSIPDTVHTLHHNIRVDQWVGGLVNPWGIDFLDPDTAVVTENPGRVRLIAKGRLSAPIENVPKVSNLLGGGGTFDVIADPAYKDNGWIYLSYCHGVEPLANGKVPTMTRIVRGRIRDGIWADEEVVFEAPAYYSTKWGFYGGRMAFDHAGLLYFSIGRRGGDGAPAQALASPLGKVHRVFGDGTVPPDNPFARIDSTAKTIYSLGHRNPQGLAVDPLTGRVWASEHGPQGGDELNLLSGGSNYGWPLATYGVAYSGAAISEHSKLDGTEQPIVYWRPSIAVSAIAFYDAELFADWSNKLLVGTLRQQELRLLTIENDRVLHQEVILKDAGRVRDVVCGPDGAVYILINRHAKRFPRNSRDMVLRLRPL